MSEEQMVFSLIFTLRYLVWMLMSSFHSVLVLILVSLFLNELFSELCIQNLLLHEEPTRNGGADRSY